MKAKGFTLIELLIVIGIIAILSVVVVLTLNPAELLRQARDSTRLSDMATLKSALALYLADVTTSYSIGDGASCYVWNTTGMTAGCDGDGAGANAPRFIADVDGAGIQPAGGNVTGPTGASATANNITGWIPVNFQLISSGAPLSALPLDPTNIAASNLYYAYRPGGVNGGICTTGLNCTEYEINANMESAKFNFSATNPGSPENSDGGNDTGLLEVGTSANLAL